MNNMNNMNNILNGMLSPSYGLGNQLSAMTTQPPFTGNRLQGEASTSPMYEAMVRTGIGFDPQFFERTADRSKYPPHNIYEVQDGVYCLTLAVAGFDESELEIVLHDDLLTISGSKVNPESVGKLLYRGIAFRDFSRQFKIGEHVEIDSAALDHGLLIINLNRRLPENLKPKRIAISS